MQFVKLYGRVLGLLAADKWVAVGLTAANIALAGLQFLEPVLFGRVVDLLSSAFGMSREAVWTALHRLGVCWKRAKHWITSPDPRYTQKNTSVTG